MNFADIENTVQQQIVELLHNHIAVSADILKTDRILLPMLMLPDTNHLVSLQPESGETDVDKAYEFVIQKLKNESFSYALFSYSTKIGFANGKTTSAIKTVIFTGNGIEVTFITPYSVKGIFKKEVQFEQTIPVGTKEKIFD